MGCMEYTNEERRKFTLSCVHACMHAHNNASTQAISTGEADKSCRTISSPIPVKTTNSFPPIFPAPFLPYLCTQSTKTLNYTHNLFPLHPYFSSLLRLHPHKIPTPSETTVSFLPLYPNPYLSPPHPPSETTPRPRGGHSW